ncbi:hypothetical protein NPIL_198171 [Nephila pilipes]|uniref:Uncharacterized protein n=1 Tax=Nephila pilipes TaxID=299642 RepID=A0A8X6UIE3_NEPPI|nr:hypothetical protein NPIL_200371 [Nephila pilipes]GFU36536.1 hypothetical protein NPIL_198171 [Nephila pilipes]
MPGISPIFTVEVKVYHGIGSLHPESNMELNFLQISFIEEFLSKSRLRIIQGIATEEIQNIQQVLHANIMLWVIDLRLLQVIDLRLLRRAYLRAAAK